MITTKTKILLFIILTIFNFSFVNANEYIFSEDIKLENINNSFYEFKININWQNITKDEFEFYKIVHSTTNKDIKYENENHIWYSSDINETKININGDYEPNLEGINYYRICITTKINKIYCSEKPLIIDLSNQNESPTNINQKEMPVIKTFLRDNKNTISFIKNDEYLSNKVGIKNDDLSILSKQFLSFEDFKKTKILIELVRNDFSNSKDIEKFVNEIKSKNFTSKEQIKEITKELNNLIDLNSRSKKDLGEYKLTLENKEKLNELKIYLENYQINNINQENNNSKNITVDLNRDNLTDTTNFDVNINSGNDTDQISLTASDIYFEYLKYFLLILLVFGLIYYFRKKLSFIVAYIDKIKTKKNIYPNYNENILQILKSENEYIVEYNGIYNKGIKVLEKNKQNITSSIYNYVNSILKMQTRGSNLLEELNNLDIQIPDLKESGNTIYRLYIPDNIRESLKNQTQKEGLIIKTDEQEIPWEIMHDSENFLSLKFPIARKIMTRESIRKNSFKKNEIPKILFISNPTGDLNGATKETNEIIKNIGHKANITLISGKEATSTKVFSLFGQDYFDIIHYSGHAYFDVKEPENSGLVLYDSLITASEIKRVLNGKPLIFLNACSSGRNDDKNFEKTGEDTVGIATSFIIGGSKGVISTLWPVTDKVSSSFAIEFYNSFLQNQTIGGALLFAKKEAYINYPNDITWASFIYYGNINLTIND